MTDDLVKRLREGWHKVECLMGQAFAEKAPGDYGYFSRSAQIRFAEMQHYVCEAADALEAKDARIAELQAAIEGILEGASDEAKEETMTASA